MAPRSSGRPGSAIPSDAPPTFERTEDTFVGRFTALGGPCEVLADTLDPAVAHTLVAEARDEALRIERKFSRYRTDGVVHRIHQSAGVPVEVDDETAGLLDYAALCHEESGGLFDLTSGVLRRVWRFDGRSRAPSPDAVAALLPLVGWTRVKWDRPWFTLPAGMEIDLGGIGKEYAVDRAAARLAAKSPCAFLVNLGGDLYASGPRSGGRPWIVGVDDPERTGEAVTHRIELPRGGLATSGDARRWVMHQGRRLGHILDPRTGWPVEGAPRAVTVLAPTCLEAGTLATFAILEGGNARAFLEARGVAFHIA